MFRKPDAGGPDFWVRTGHQAEQSFLVHLTQAVERPSGVDLRDWIARLRGLRFKGRKDAGIGALDEEALGGVLHPAARTAQLFHQMRPNSGPPTSTGSVRWFRR